MGGPTAAYCAALCVPAAGFEDRADYSTLRNIKQTTRGARCRNSGDLARTCRCKRTDRILFLRDEGGGKRARA